VSVAHSLGGGGRILKIAHFRDGQSSIDSASHKTKCNLRPVIDSGCHVQSRVG